MINYVHLYFVSAQMSTYVFINLSGKIQITMWLIGRLWLSSPEDHGSNPDGGEKIFFLSF